MYTILIVDDEKRVIHHLSEDINWGSIKIQRVLTATSAHSALELMDQNRIDLIVADIAMPRMNGLELAQKARAKWPYVKTIILSGYDEFAYAQTALKLKVNAYLAKPTPYEELLETAKKALAEYDQELHFKKVLEESRQELRQKKALLVETALRSFLRYDKQFGDETREIIKPNNGSYYFFVALKIDDLERLSKTSHKEVQIQAVGKIGRKVLFRKGTAVLQFTDIDDTIYFIVQDRTQPQISTHQVFIREMGANGPYVKETIHFLHRNRIVLLFFLVFRIIKRHVQTRNILFYLATIGTGPFLEF